MLIDIGPSLFSRKFLMIISPPPPVLVLSVGFHLEHAKFNVPPPLDFLLEHAKFSVPPKVYKRPPLRKKQGQYQDRDLGGKVLKLKQTLGGLRSECKLKGKKR